MPHSEEKRAKSEGKVNRDLQEPTLNFARGVVELSQRLCHTPRCQQFYKPTCSRVQEYDDSRTKDT